MEDVLRSLVNTVSYKDFYLFVIFNILHECLPVSVCYYKQFQNLTLSLDLKTRMGGFNFIIFEIMHNFS